MKKNRVYTVNSLLARIGGNYKFWLIALPAVTMLAQAPGLCTCGDYYCGAAKQCHGERFR